MPPASWGWAATVYPRVGGETVARMAALNPVRGLSPRGRGNLVVVLRPFVPLGSIPAWAGKPCPARSTRLTRRVYPRVGGETAARPGEVAHVGGLSPRGRGNLRLQPFRPLAHRSIPAWAGKPERDRLVANCYWVYPRVGGETASVCLRAPSTSGLSPRGRGNQPAVTRAVSDTGSIPAWAGKPKKVGSRPPSIWLGLSPRGRGNHPSMDNALGAYGSIPAWAGKPSAIAP